MKKYRPSVLVIDEDFAIAKNSGKRIRTANLLESCARSFSITYVAYVAGNDEAVAAAATWNPLGVTTLPVQRPKVAKSGFGQLITAARTLWRQLPANVVAWQTERFTKTVLNILRTGRFDLIHCEITQMAWAVPFGTGVPTILNAHNVESVIWERLAGVRRGLLRWMFRNQAAKVHKFESDYLPRFDEVICVSKIDRERMRNRFGVTNALVLPNGADLTMQPLPPAAAPPVLLYPSALDWRPAQDGAVFLLREILPQVRKRYPETRVAIVGKAPPRWMRRLCANTPGVECHSNVPFMEPYYRQARLVVVPLRVGSGSRLKILEALAYGRAVVSTTVGVEGLELTNGLHLSVADGAGPFANAVCYLLENNDRRCSLAREGRKAVEEHYNWTVISEEMADTWRSVSSVKRSVG